MAQIETPVSTTSPPSSPAVTLFSDPSASACTPPSSPPGLPPPKIQDTVATSRLQRPTRNAFSVLGKRKALSPLDDNISRGSKRPGAQLMVGVTSGAASVTSTSTRKMSDRPKPLTQMQLSCGQQTQRRCATCGMEYVPSSAEDRRLHDEHHRRHTSGYGVGKDFVEKLRRGNGAAAVCAGVREGDAVCLVRAQSGAAYKRRVRDVLDIVTSELGAVAIPDAQLWKDDTGVVAGDVRRSRYSALLYIRDGTCVGFLLAEHITQALRVEEPIIEAVHEGGKTGPRSALLALKERKQALARAAEAPLRLSTRKHPASLGISRIWVSREHRHQDLAMRMLDVALDIVGGGKADEVAQRSRTRTLVAFSQPTQAGIRLARRWFGTLWGWGVYVD